MTKLFQVVVTDTLPEIGAECKILDELADVKLLQTNDDGDVARLGPDADVLLVYHTIKISERTIATLHKCKGIIRCGVGYDNVDIEAAGSRGIVCCNVPDYGTEEVADHALLMLLAIARRFLPANQSVTAGHWNYQVAIETPRLRGRTLGVIGCGRIGTAMVLRAKAIGMRVVVFDPYKPDGLEKALGVERVHRLEDLLRQAEFVSVHCPLTPETRHILNARTLSLLPKGAYVINTARGPCVDANGLLQAIDAGQVAYAALDVVEKEPLEDERLRKHPRVVLTPHTAFYSIEGYQEMRSKGAEEARRILLGEKVRNPVNLHLLKNPRCIVS
jgi:phosphoglycerate dehydrogenase-like enzyme